MWHRVQIITKYSIEDKYWYYSWIDIFHNQDWIGFPLIFWWLSMLSYLSIPSISIDSFKRKLDDSEIILSRPLWSRFLKTNWVKLKNLNVNYNTDISWLLNELDNDNWIIVLDVKTILSHSISHKVSLKLFDYDFDKNEYKNISISKYIDDYWLLESLWNNLIDEDIQETLNYYQETFWIDLSQNEIKIKLE